MYNALITIILRGSDALSMTNAHAVADAANSIALGTGLMDNIVASSSRTLYRLPFSLSECQRAIILLYRSVKCFLGNLAWKLTLGKIVANTLISSDSGVA